jgi:hypothetical protein
VKELSVEDPKVEIKILAHLIACFVCLREGDSGGDQRKYAKKILPKSIFNVYNNS